jgi:hypothetical protein
MVSLTTAATATAVLQQLTVTTILPFGKTGSWDWYQNRRVATNIYIPSGLVTVRTTLRMSGINLRAIGFTGVGSAPPADENQAAPTDSSSGNGTLIHSYKLLHWLLAHIAVYRNSCIVRHYSVVHCSTSTLCTWRLREAAVTFCCILLPTVF